MVMYSVSARWTSSTEDDESVLTRPPASSDSSRLTFTASGSADLDGVFFAGFSDSFFDDDGAAASFSGVDLDGVTGFGGSGSSGGFSMPLSATGN
jgi:hypothetical protein